MKPSAPQKPRTGKLGGCHTHLARNAWGKTSESGGIARMLETGDLPADADLEQLLLTENFFRAKKIQVCPYVPPLSSRVMTDISPYSRTKKVMLDFADIEKLPSKLNLKDLKEWELAQTNDLGSLSTSAFSTLFTVPSSGVKEQVVQREDTRTYAELLDVYSMHEFIIRKGAALRTTPEFASFKRRYIAFWGNIELVIRRLEEFLRNYGVELAYVDGKNVAELAKFQVDDILSREDLLHCLANREEVEPLTRSATQQYAFGIRGRHLAAQKIQATWRMYTQRLAYRHLLVGTRAAIVVQRKWALYRSHVLTRKTIRALRETRMLRWKKTMENFIKNWNKRKKEHRTIVHLPSLSYPCFHAKRVPFYFALQMGQLTRLVDLQDPNVDVIFLAPFRPEPEVMDYYYTLLEDSGVKNPRGRLTLLVPEDVKRLPPGLSLTRLVLMSSRLMKCLSALCRTKYAYVIPGVVGAEELLFATELNIPLLSGDPTVTQAFATKSGFQRLLELAEVQRLTGAYGLRNRSELLSALASLMINHREVTRWLVKLETESCSRGHAYFDVNRIRVLSSTDESQRTYDNVLRELEEHAARRARLVHVNSYPDWEAYVTMFDAVGGCVEAVPSRIRTNLTANLFVEPSGVVSLDSVVETLLAPAYTVMGCHFPPQRFVPFETVRDVSISVANAAFRRRIMGYMSVDLVLYNASEEGPFEVSVVDVDLCLTNNAAAHQFVCLVTNSSFDINTGNCIFANSDRMLSYAYSGIIYSPFISSVRHRAFFSLCRSKGLSFDRKMHMGLLFHMVDVFLRGCIGVLSVGSKRGQVTRGIKEFQYLLNLELPKQSEHSAESNFVYFSSAIQQMIRSVTISKEM